MTHTTQELLRALPPVEELLHDTRLEALYQRLPRKHVVDAVRHAVDTVRERILSGDFELDEADGKDGASVVSAADENADAPVVSATTEKNDAFDATKLKSALAQRIIDETLLRAAILTKPSLRRVINASGVIIHTNLGRSPLAPDAVRAVEAIARGYSTLEYDTDAMARGNRHDHCEQLLCALTGAEAAIAVNNNAAAVMMVLSTFAAGSRAIVSRGELVEIGGSFRIPDIMEQSNALMTEVGTTNKTHLSDYERALTPDTAMLLKVHPSNYRMTGFVEAVEVAELRELADAENERRRATAAVGAGLDVDGAAASASATDGSTDTPQPLPLLVYEDQGSGAFLHLDCFGSYAEPTVSASLRAGADLVSFSGDKLLGGPQAGIIVGRADLIARLKKSSLARVLRLDKMTLAALEATLRLYLDPARAASDIPTLRMLTESPKAVRERAERIYAALKQAMPQGCAELDIVPEIARAGGGALPMCDIDTFCVRVRFARGNALACERHLVRAREIPVICRIHKDTVLVDARTVLDADEINEIARAFGEYFAQPEARSEAQPEAQPSDVKADAKESPDE